MPRFISGAAHWVARHSFAAAAAAVLVVGAAGGGVGYAVAGQHNPTAASTGPSGSAPVSPSTPPTRSRPRPAAGAATARGQTLLAGALGLIAKQTGLPVATVRKDLAGGQSVDQIAGANAPAVASQIMASITTLADRARNAGRITAAQESAGLALATSRLSALLAKPGPQLIEDLQSLLQFLPARALPRVTPPPAATAPPTPAT
jgi:hypothetical protein